MEALAHKLAMTKDRCTYVGKKEFYLFVPIKIKSTSQSAVLLQTDAALTCTELQ